MTGINVGVDVAAEERLVVGVVFTGEDIAVVLSSFTEIR